MTQQENFRNLLIAVVIMIGVAIMHCKGSVKSGAHSDGPVLLVQAGCGFCKQAKKYIEEKKLKVPMREATSSDFDKYKIRGVPALILSPSEKVVGWGDEMKQALDKFK